MRHLANVIVFSAAAASWAASPPARKAEHDPDRARQEQVRMKERFEKAQAEELRALKKRDPARYAERERALEIERRIDGVLERFHGGAIAKARARDELRPLVRESLKPEVAGLEARIEEIEKRLAFLKKARANPDLLVDRQIDERLGLRAPETPIF